MRSFTLILLFASITFAQETVPLEEIDARLRQIASIARETNNRTLVDDLLSDRDAVHRAVQRKDTVLIERLLREMEKRVGLDVGGQSMHGLPVARVTYQEQKKLAEYGKELAQAMQAADRPAVLKAVKKTQELLGERAGVPDVRRKGEDSKIFPIKPADVTDLFVKILDVEAPKLKKYIPGEPIGTLMPRDYASIVQGCVAMRAAIAKQHPNKLELLDQVISGACQSLMTIQHETGFMKFPDLRGKHIRFSEMIEQIVEQSAANVQDGWVVIPAPDGGSQFDTGEAGLALLRAGVVLKNDKFIAAGLKAADWAKTAPLVANFNYNAFSVSLLCEAYLVKKDEQYLTAAWKKWEYGVGSGQLATGRWVDPHNARTVYHFLMMRAGNDLLTVSPIGEQKTALKKQMQLAVKTVLDEADKLGSPTVSLTIQELARVADLADVTDSRLRPTLEKAATIAHLKCSKNGVRAAIPLPEFAALSDIWK